MRIHHLNCATMCPYGRKLVNGHGGLFEAGRQVCHCFLIEAGSRLVLVDTGYGLDDLKSPNERLGRVLCWVIRPKLDPAECAISQVQALGFDPQDVQDIIVTHLDGDHAGGLPDFPWARVHVHRAEQLAAMNPRGWLSRQRYCQSHWAHAPKWVPHEPDGDTWHGFEAVRPLAGTEDEILLVPLLGHSTGHCGIAVRDEDGWVLHAGDALFHHWQLDPQRRKPPFGVGLMRQIFQVDRRARFANEQRLLELAQRSSNAVRIVCSHDPDLLPASLSLGPNKN